MARIGHWIGLAFAAIFASLGLFAVIAAPEFLAQYDLAASPPKGMAEARCFFGGNFLAWAVALTVGTFNPPLRRGLFLAVAMGLTMVGLIRLPSMALDGEIVFNTGAMVAELVMAAVLVLTSHPPRTAA